MKTIKGFENEDIIVSDFGEWVGKNYIDYKAEYKRNQKFIEILLEEKKQLKDKLYKIETLIINHNCDTGDIYYKYNSRFLKSELKQRILEIVYEQGRDSNE